MISNISYIFPKSTKNEQVFFGHLCDLLLELPNAKQQDASIIVAPEQPKNALPVTTFAQANVSFPQIHFGDVPELSFGVGNLHVNPKEAKYSTGGSGFDHIFSKQDALGPYYQLQIADFTMYRLPMQELAKRLKGHITRIDHTGLNVPTAFVAADEWQQITSVVAKNANFYKYPTGEDWPFIVPATKAEYAADITDFVAGRDPKFELVYDAYSLVPTIQLDIETNLTRAEVEQLFPKPYGISFHELAEYFRTVYVHHDWLGLNIRFDIRFKNNEPNGAWETGKWLVQDGGRIS